MASNITSGYLTGQLLIAMPTMGDPRFSRTVIYMCVHNGEGAMGLVINKLIGSLTLQDLLQQLEIEASDSEIDMPVHFGGPVESSRGFVLHSDDYMDEGSMPVADGMALTATVDVLREIAEGGGPGRAILALGYSGWGPGQLESEIQANGWLQVAADPALVFDDDNEGKWVRAINKIGVDLSMLSGDAGHA